MIQAKHLLNNTQDGGKGCLFPKRKETDFPAALRARKSSSHAGRPMAAFPWGSEKQTSLNFVSAIGGGKKKANLIPIKPG
jgi:hypothetical protein